MRTCKECGKFFRGSVCDCGAVPAAPPVQIARIEPARCWTYPCEKMGKEWFMFKLPNGESERRHFCREHADEIYFKHLPMSNCTAVVIGIKAAKLEASQLGISDKELFQRNFKSAMESIRNSEKSRRERRVCEKVTSALNEFYETPMDEERREKTRNRLRQIAAEQHENSQNEKKRQHGG